MSGRNEDRGRKDRSRADRSYFCIIKSDDVFRERFRSGRLSATVAQDPAKIGATSLDLLVEAVKAGKLTPVGAAPKQVAVDSVLVTK